MYVRSTICYLSSIMIFGAYCVGKVDNMLPMWNYDNGRLLWLYKHIVNVMSTICYLSGIMIFGAYCVGKVDDMLPWWYYDNGSILCR